MKECHVSGTTTGEAVEALFDPPRTVSLFGLEVAWIGLGSVIYFVQGE